MSESTMSMESTQCSFVGVDYIICECGDNFANEQLLQEHLRESHDVDPNPRFKEEIVEEEIHEDVPEYYQCEEVVQTQEHLDVPVTKGVVYSIKTRIKDEQIEFVVEEPDESEEVKFGFAETSEVKSEAYDNEVILEEVYQDDTELALATENLLQEHLNLDESHVNESYVSTEELLREHMTDKNFTLDNKLRFCDPCRKIFTNEQAYRSHCARVHLQVLTKPAPNKTAKPKKPRPPQAKKVVTRSKVKNRMCEVCGKSFASNAALNYHQRIHTGERPYICSLCEKGFTMPLLLQIHLRVHTGERPYQCQQCPKAFSNKAAINRHMRVHTGVKPYPCPECGKTFTQSNSMKLHIRTVHLKLPAPYKSKKRKQQAAEKLRQAQIAKMSLGVKEEMNSFRIFSTAGEEDSEEEQM